MLLIYVRHGEKTVSKDTNVVPTIVNRYGICQHHEPTLNPAFYFKTDSIRCQTSSFPNFVSAEKRTTSRGLFKLKAFAI